MYKSTINFARGLTIATDNSDGSVSEFVVYESINQQIETFNSDSKTDMSEVDVYEESISFRNRDTGTPKDTVFTKSDEPQSKRESAQNNDAKNKHSLKPKKIKLKKKSKRNKERKPIKVKIGKIPLNAALSKRPRIFSEAQKKRQTEISSRGHDNLIEKGKFENRNSGLSDTQGLDELSNKVQTELNSGTQNSNLLNENKLKSSDSKNSETTKAENHQYEDSDEGGSIMKSVIVDVLSSFRDADIIPRFIIAAIAGILAFGTIFSQLGFISGF